MSRNVLLGVFVCCFFTNLVVAEKGSAQSMENVFLHVTARNSTVEQILRDIEADTPFSFFYNKNRIEAMPHRITLPGKRRSVADVLDIISRETGLRFRQISSTITVNSENIEKANIRISGVVYDATTDEGLPGVNIMVKGTTTGTSSDTEGRYSLSAPTPEDTLVFSFIGYQTQEVAVNGRSTIDIVLQPQAITGDEVVVVGYGTQEKVNLTGSVKQIGGEELQKQASILPSAALMGKTAGVTVLQNSGQPGRNQGDIQIRGIGTLSNSNALVLIDGVEGSLDDISSADIEDISVLKDAASASIYGSRAANGVILITTKRGQRGDVQVDYNSLYGWNEPTRQPEYVDAGTFMRLENEGATNLGKDPVWSEEYIREWEENYKTDPNNYPNTDWVNEVFSEAGFQQTHQLSVAGGRDKLRFRGSLNYDQEDGTIPNFNFRRYSFRINTDVVASDRLDFNFDLSTIRKDRTRASQSLDLIARQAFRIPPIYAARYTNGEFGPGWDGRNPVAYAEAGGVRTDEDYGIKGRIKARFEPVKGLGFDLLYAPEYENTFFKRMRKQYQVFDPNTGDLLHVEPLKNDLLEGYNRNFTHNLNLTANYQTDLKDHNLKLLGGYELIDYHRDVFEAYRDDFILQDFTELDAASSANQQNSGRSTAFSLQSFFGRLNYNFKSKYLFEANIRYDGSSRFAEDVQWGLFPSFSAGWNVAEEPFMNAFDFISTFKVRTSWGELGNQDVGGSYFPFAAVINLDQKFIFGDVPVPGAAQLNFANENLTWEETTTFDAGVDVALFDDRLDFTFDWFKRTTDDILLDLPIPTIVGMNAPYQNAGKVENTGWEIEAGYRTNINRDFTLGISLNLSDVHNKVIDLRDTGPFIDEGRNEITKEKYPIGSIYGYVAEGLFESQEEIDNHATQTGQIAPGDIKYKDMLTVDTDGDGIPDEADGIINADDRTVIGDPFPRYNYGITINASYKNFDFSALFQGIGKRDVLLTGDAVWAFHNAGKIAEWQAEDYWRPNNTDASYPRLTQTTSHNNYQASSYWVYDASYLRLRNLQVGYTLPVSLVSQLALRNVRVFFSGQNLFTLFDNLPPGVDPNVTSSTNGAYFPVNRLLAGGIEVNF